MERTAGRFTSAEERANYLSHGFGALLALIGFIFLLIKVIPMNNVLYTSAIFVYGFSLTLLYTASFLNHWLPAGQAKDFMFSLDQVAVYFLIAGTYTPFALIAFSGKQGWIYFFVEWFLAIGGIILRLLQTRKYEQSVNYLAIISYVIMGWLILADVSFAVERLSLNGFYWIIGGGLVYTLGILFFKMERVHFHHLIWHIATLTGSAMHYIAVYKYALP